MVAGQGEGGSFAFLKTSLNLFPKKSRFLRGNLFKISFAPCHSKPSCEDEFQMCPQTFQVRTGILTRSQGIQVHTKGQEAMVEDTPNFGCCTQLGGKHTKYALLRGPTPAHQARYANKGQHRLLRIQSLLLSCSKKLKLDYRFGRKIGSAFDFTLSELEQGTSSTFQQALHKGCE